MEQIPKLVSFDLCPYVERSRIVFLEKNVEHTVELIDLKNKPGWFLEISPMGKVPVLLVEGRPIFESMVINELLEELYPTPALFPKEPLARAEARGWIVFANDQLMPVGHRAQLALAGDVTGPGREQPLDGLREAFGRLDRAVGQHGGPFFMGAAFGLVDAAYAPFFRRWQAAERWSNLEMLGTFPTLRRYAETLLAHPSVVKADPGNIGPRMRAFLAERAANPAR